MDKTAERNHGLFRIASLTAWVAGGAVAVTGVFTFLAAHPKLHLLPKPVSTNTNTGGTSGGDLSSTGVDNSSAGSSVSGGGLQAPAQVPAVGRGSAHVSSGGS
jgi:hypothetical protein